MYPLGWEMDDRVRSDSRDTQQGIQFEDGHDIQGPSTGGSKNACNRLGRERERKERRKREKEKKA